MFSCQIQRLFFPFPIGYLGVIWAFLLKHLMWGFQKGTSDLTIQAPLKSHLGLHSIREFKWATLCICYAANSLYSMVNVEVTSVLACSSFLGVEVAKFWSWTGHFWHGVQRKSVTGRIALCMWLPGCAVRLCVIPAIARMHALCGHAMDLSAFT